MSPLLRKQDNTKVEVVELSSHSYVDSGFVSDVAGADEKAEYDLGHMIACMSDSELKGREGIKSAYSIPFRPYRVHPRPKSDS